MLLNIFFLISTMAFQNAIKKNDFSSKQIKKSWE